MPQSELRVKPENLVNAISLSVNKTHIGKKPKTDADWTEYNQSFRPATLSITEIADTISSGYAIAPVVHKNRSSENFVSTQMVGSDMDNSSIDQARRVPLIDNYGTMLHTTSSHTDKAPRTRAIFILEEIVTDATHFAEIATALTWYNNLSDPQCKDPARMWFGAKGCHMEIDKTKILPMSVISQIIDEYNDSQKTQPENGGFLTGNPGEIFNNAIVNIKPGKRNEVGFDMCCRLRDIGLSKDDAMEYAHLYYEAAKLIGDHPYELREILASLRSAYSRKPRRMSKDVLNQQLATWEYNAWHNRSGLKKGALHYSLKTVMAVSQMAEKAGRTTNLNLPVREFIDYGIPKTPAAKHIAAMIEGGTLTADKQDKRRGNSYSLTIQPIGENTITDITSTETYKQLQWMPHFDYGARIDAKLWTECPPDSNLGPSALRIISTLAIDFNRRIGAKVGHSCNEREEGVAVCPTFAPILSLTMLWKVAGVGTRTGKSCFKTLVDLGICEWEYADNKSKIPTLCENWYERLLEIEPALTTFGNKERRKFNYAKQRELHHKAIGRFGSDAEKEISQQVIERASVNSAVAHEKFQSAKKKQELWKSEIERKYKSNE